MKSEEALRIILETKVVAVIRMKDPRRLAQVVEAIRAGGVRAVEITMTVPGAADIIRDLVRNKPADGLVGAGTVLDAVAAEAVLDAGAEFVVSPVTDFDVIRLCRGRGVMVVPGAYTPTEILAAWRAGADIVKVFPATSLGPQFFRDLKGPLPDIRLMPTGGVSVENARDFIAHGACAVAVGTALLDKKLIDAGDWAALTKKARDLVLSLREAPAQ